MTQVPISKYFKSISRVAMEMNRNNKIAQETGSFPPLTSTPNKNNTGVNDVIDLVSDSEEDLPSGSQGTDGSDPHLEPLFNVECVMSDSVLDSSFSSTKTIIYGSPHTPIKAQTSPKSNGLLSSGKRYSPYKNKMVTRKTPVKRNLAVQSFNHQVKLFDPNQRDADLNKVLIEIDDKTNFLQLIIYKFLNTSELRHLLEKISQDLLLRTVHLGIPHMRLVCRLYWRKRGWYKSDKLAAIAKGKQEINFMNIPQVLDELIQNGFLAQSEGNESLSFSACSNLLLTKQCIEICKSLSLKCLKSTRKCAISALKDYSRSKSIDTYFKKNTASHSISNAERVLKLMQDKLGSCYRLSDLACETLNKLYLLMYLGMDYTIIREKKLELTLINDKNNSETYPMDREIILDNASVVFRTQTEFERYYEAHNVYESYLLQTVFEKKLEIVQNVHDKYKSISTEEFKSYKVLPVWLRKFTPAYLYVKILEKGVLDLKKVDKYQSAVDVLTTLTGQNAFRQHKKAEWYAEKALILHKHVHQYDAAGEVLLEGLRTDIPNTLKQVLLQRAKQLVNQKNISLQEVITEQLLSVLIKEPPISEKDFSADHVYKQHMDREGKGKRKFITRTEDEITAQDAEDYCISHYKQNGMFTHGAHWEGSIVTTIFTLLFWDIIYTKLRGYSGIFMCPYQVYPLDMFSTSFYENRKDLIEERLAWIQSSSTDSLREEMRKVWDSRPESEISDIRRNLGWERVQQVCECAGARHLASLCRRLAMDYAHARSGFPDLTLWDINTKRIKFVEVKTDTDKPSVKQLQWMRYLKSVGIDTGFCYIGVNTERSTRQSDQPDSA